MVAGKYRIRRVVGTGSMGVVCEAENVAIGKRVAIKLIDAALAGMHDIAARFRQEARAASIVESNHIVQVFDVGTDEKLGLYLVMEYLVGEDVENLLKRERKVGPDHAVRIAVQVARGLAKAHGAGVVHRDMKPSNIFLCKRDDDVEHVVKILDFGISKVIEANREQPKLKLTRAGTVVGTPQYMSPEQAQGFSVDQRTDIWSLGLVVYEMLAGQPAYPELPTYEQFIIHLVSHPPEPLHEVAPWVPEALSEAVHTALEHDAAKRIPTCIEFAKRLLAANPLKTLAMTGATPIEPPDTWDDPEKKAPTEAERAHARSEEPIPSTQVPSTQIPSTQVPSTEADGSETLVMSSPPPGMGPRSDPPRTKRMAPPAPPAAPKTPRMAQLPDNGPPSEDEDDAPQFFRRDELQRIADMARDGTPTGTPIPVEVTVTPVMGVAAMAPPRADPIVVEPGPETAPSALKRTSRVRAAIAWVLVAVAVGVVVVVALSMR
jgi:serine/threonine protein kinase